VTGPGPRIEDEGGPDHVTDGAGPGHETEEILAGTAGRDLRAERGGQDKGGWGAKSKGGISKRRESQVEQESQWHRHMCVKDKFPRWRVHMEGKNERVKIPPRKTRHVRFGDADPETGLQQEEEPDFCRQGCMKEDGEV
ncbi:hypothetical protein Bbelb_212480, partial [Branchiostoma belcheri]